MNTLRKVTAILGFGLGFLLLVEASQIIGWALILGGPRGGNFTSLSVHILSWPYTLFFAPAFLIPPGSPLDSPWGVALITVLLVGFWGSILRTTWVSIRRYKK